MASLAVSPEPMDLPEPEPPPSSVPLVERGLHKLTPIEAPFYDALQETDLTFAVQPRVQGPDRVYRPDFIVFYAGQAAVVEIDGHEGHKTREQRTDDAERQHWFEKRRLRVFRWTGSQVHANATDCIAQLMDILRGTQARP
jgi:very-short-patch-repair endonuclease